MIGVAFFAERCHRRGNGLDPLLEELLPRQPFPREHGFGQ
jgi:hypothetical protein